MIPNQWYIILESKDLGNKILGLTRLNEKMILWRDSNGNVCCIADKCCHRGASLSSGKIIEGSIECPFHGFRFNEKGDVICIPANGKNSPVPENMKVYSYKTFEDHGFIWIWWGEKDKATVKPFFFSELSSMSYSSFQDHWNVHYSRAIENQLDVVHLPFVHKTTIGRGNKTLVNGPVVTREAELLTFYVNNIVDDGNTRALKPNEIKDYERLFHLQFHFPNIWQNFISDKMRIFAAFVPIDDENTIIIIRNYQSMVKVPVLKQIFNFFGKLSSIVILRQDKRVVLTQLPKSTNYKMDEQLITGDLPIIEYRKFREELKTRV